MTSSGRRVWLVIENSEKFTWTDTNNLFPTDIENAIKNKKIGSLIGVEGGHSIQSSFAILRIMHELGVRYMTLTQ